MTEEIYEHLKRLEPFKIEFLDEKDKYYQLDSYIEQVNDDYIIVSPPKDSYQTYDLPVGSAVSMVFYRTNGMLYAESKVLGKHSTIQPRLKMSLPYNIELIERRKARRVRLRLKTEIEYYINKNTIDKKVLNVTTNDISTNGFSYIDKYPFGNYHNIKCSIYLNSDYSNPLKVNCNYVYSKKKQRRDETFYHIALKFTKISKEDSLRIQQACFRKRFS